MKTPLLILAALAFGGCKSIPAVSAGKASYDSTHPFGSTSISIEGARVTDARVEVDGYRRKSRWGWGGLTLFSQDVTVIEYARDRKPGEGEKIATP